MNQRDNIDSYYYFDDKNREIHFKRYDMPTPWMNYLSNGTFHTMISHAGGGVAFYKSPQIWRINHYRFFHLPTDRSGFYTYIKDEGEVWCPTNQPVKLKPDFWEGTHGMGYTRFHAKRKGLSVKADYFVGKYENALVWNLTLKSDTDKKIMIYPFAELGMMEFMRELQWQCYNKHQLSVYYLKDDEILIYKYGVETQPKPEETPLVYFAANVPVKSWDGDRDEFIGAYRSEEDPEGVGRNCLSNSLLQGGDPCFAFQLEVSLNAGEEKSVQIYLGTGMTEKEIIQSVSHCREKDFASKSFQALQEEWEEYFNHFQCKIPDRNAERMINTWNPYQSQRNFLFSRNISYYATGTFRGVGFRDTAQDVLAMIPFSIKEAKAKTRLLLSQQYFDGHVNHYFFPIEGYPPVTSIHSDDHLWIIMTVYGIIQEDGIYDFLMEEIPYYDSGKGSVYSHLMKAVSYTMNNLGINGFPLMLRSDWNDALFRVCREGKGESIWTSMQFGTVLRYLAEMAEGMGELREAEYCLEIYDQQKEIINKNAWDGSWYRRAVMDNGEYLGTNESPEAKIWLNTQTWAVLSGMGEAEKCRQAMDSVYRILNTPVGIKKIHPPIVNFPDPKEPLTNYNPGTGENGSVFCHANTWAVIAECILGNPERAYEYYQKLIPKRAMEEVGIWRYKAEPYAYVSNIFGPDSLRFGLANVSWLTGTASWMYIAVTQFILGVRAEFAGLRVEPCLTAHWDGAVVNRLFRGCRYHITMKKAEGRRGLVVDGQLMKDNLITHQEGIEDREVIYYF